MLLNFYVVKSKSDADTSVGCANFERQQQFFGDAKDFLNRVTVAVFYDQ